MQGTRITIPIGRHDGTGSFSAIVREDFDEVLERVAPMTQPSSALEHRARSVYIDLAGNRMYAPPQAIALVEENVEAEE